MPDEGTTIARRRLSQLSFRSGELPAANLGFDGFGDHRLAGEVAETLIRELRRRLDHPIVRRALLLAELYLEA